MEAERALLALDDEVAQSSTDPQVISTARSMVMIARQADELAVQRAIVMYGLNAHNLTPVMLRQLTASIAEQKADLTEFQDFATTTQVTEFNGLMAASLEDRALSDEQIFLSNTTRLASLPVVSVDWWGTMSSAIKAAHRFEEALANSAADRARILRNRAITSAVVIGGVILLVLVLSLFLTVFALRSMAGRAVSIQRSGGVSLVAVAWEPMSPAHESRWPAPLACGDIWSGGG